MVHLPRFPSALEQAAIGLKRAKVFWTGRSQAVRLPKGLCFATDTVLVHREGEAVFLAHADERPEGYVESFAGVPEDLERPAQDWAR